MTPGIVTISSKLIILLLVSHQVHQSQQQQLLTGEQSLRPASQDTDSHQASSPALHTTNGCNDAGYLLADATDEQLNRSDIIDSTILSLLARDGPDMRPLRDFRDYDDITLDVAKRAWQLMHQHAQRATADKVKLATPSIERALLGANVSTDCSNAIQATLVAAQRLDSWAIQCK